MKPLNTHSLKRSVTLSVVVAMIILVIITVGATSFMQKIRQQQLIQEYGLQIHKGIEHSIAHYIKDYTYRLHRLTTTTPLSKWLKEKKREDIYKFFKPKWDLLRTEEKNFTLMHIHLKDGTSFLRMHKPENFGDQLSHLRPMMKEIHSSHQVISGYETGKHAAPFRIIEPIFDKQKNYLGAIEIGLEPNFILDTIHEINGFSGLLFIKDDELELLAKKQNPRIIDGYRLRTALTPELQTIYKKLEKLNHIDNGITIHANDKVYLSHLFTLNDFQGKTKVKILFFQDITYAGSLRKYLLAGILTFFTLSFGLLAWFIYRRIGIYQEDVEEIYQEQVNQIDESENRFRLLYEKAPQAYQSLDFDGNILTVNSKWSEELGFSTEEIIGKNFSDFLVPEFKEKFAEIFPKFKEEGEISHIEFDMICKSGEIITVSIDGKIVKDEKGKLLQTHCIFSNITQQKKLQNRLELSQNYLQSIFNVTPNIMITTTGDQIDNANPAMLEFFGYDSLDSFKKEHSCVCEYFTGENHCLSAVMDGMSWLEYIYAHPSEIHRVCMHKGDQKHRFLVWAKPLHLDDKVRSVVTFHDITEIEERRERYEFALNGTQDGLWDWNLTNNEVYFSPRWKSMLGYEDDELINELETWEKLVHPDDLRQATEDIERSHQNPDIPFENIHRLRHKDGHWVWILDRGQTIFNAKGEALRMVGYHTDISKQKILEHELREANQQFDLFMDNIPAAIIIKDHKNHTLYANPYTLDFFKKTTISGKDAYGMFPKEVADKFQILNDRAKAEGFAEDVIVIPNPEGGDVIVRVLTFAIEQENRETRTGSIYLDITDKYKDQHQLVQLKTAVESAPISIVVTDLHGEIEYANPWFLQLTGYSLKGAIGQNPRMLKSGYTSDEEYKILWDTISQGDVWSGTFKNLKKDGSVYWESAIISPVLDSEDNIINYIAIKQEITEHLYLKEELNKQSEKNIELGSILEEVANEVYIFSKATQKFLYVNKEALRNTGYRSEELYEMTPLDIKPDVTQEELNAILLNLSTKKLEKVFVQTRHQRKDGTRYPIDSYLQEALFEGEDVYMAITIDTSEQMKIRQKLHDQEELMIAQSRHAAMGEMIGMIAHQWRQPITVIAMGANNILADIALENIDTEAFKQQSDSILKQTAYLSKTIDDFRNFFRPNKEMEEVRLEEVMLEAEKIVGKSLENNMIRLSIKHENGYKIKTYSRELLQVYINLLKNAKEALIENRSQDRYINVIISDDDKNVITTICDNGGGIDTNTIPKIFDPYFSTKDEKSGTGLGLYMSKTIIEKHLQGTIEAQNSSDGVCFIIKLPVNRKENE